MQSEWRGTNGDGVSGSSQFLLKAAAAAAGKKPAGKGRQRDERHGTREGGTEGEEADSELIDDYCKRRLSASSVRPTVTAFGGRWDF